MRKAREGFYLHRAFRISFAPFAIKSFSYA